jgi:hypothetical protein
MDWRLGVSRATSSMARGFEGHPFPVFVKNGKGMAFEGVAFETPRRNFLKAFYFV